MRENELRARLTALADATAPPPRADLAAVVEHRHRGRRRTQLRVGAAAVAVAAVAVAVPQVLDGQPAEEGTPSLITCAALLDVLTTEELGCLADAIERLGAPALLSLSVDDAPPAR